MFRIFFGASSSTTDQSPTDLVGMAGGPNRIDLTWTPDSAATSQLVQRRVGAGSWSDLATIGAAFTTYSDSTAVGGTTYDYQIVTTTVGGSLVSNVATVLALAGGRHLVGPYRFSLAGAHNLAWSP